MSSRDCSRRTVLRLVLAAGAALALSACLRPLNGPTASGANLSSVLASIEIGPMSVPIGQERFSHYLQSELTYDLDGSGLPHPKRYRLTLGLGEALQTPIVDTLTGRADSATLVGNVTYTLTAIDGGRIIAAGRATGSATYDRTAQRFATVRAARDAEIRMAQLVSEQIKTRLAAVLAATP